MSAEPSPPPADGDDPVPAWFSTRIEPHRLADRIRGKLLFLIAVPAFCRALRSSVGTELWIGDSHTVTLNRRLTNSMFCTAPEGQIILRVGPRLMHSLAKDGFPPRVGLTAWLIRHAARPGAFFPIFSAGEIDVRVHLAKRPEDALDWTTDYVDRCVAVAEQMGVSGCGVVIPLAPANVPPELIWYPVHGTISERLTMHARLRDRIVEAASVVNARAGGPRVTVIDANASITRPSGSTPLGLTIDGVHNTPAVIPLVREAVNAARRQSAVPGPADAGRASA